MRNTLRKSNRLVSTLTLLVAFALPVGDSWPDQTKLISLLLTCPDADSIPGWILPARALLP